MDDKTLIAKRVAQELQPGYLVNLGIGLPTMVASHVPPDAHIFFQSENGIIGMQSVPEEGLESDDLTDAAGRPISALPGAATFDSAMSFGLIRGGHLDVTVLGGLQALAPDAPFPMGGSCSPQPTVLAPLRAVCMTCHGQVGDIIHGAMTHGPQNTRVLSDPARPFVAVRDEKLRRPELQALLRSF